MAAGGGAMSLRETPAFAEKVALSDVVAGGCVKLLLAAVAEALCTNPDLLLCMQTGHISISYLM